MIVFNLTKLEVVHVQKRPKVSYIYNYYVCDVSSHVAFVKFKSSK